MVRGAREFRDDYRYERERQEREQQQREDRERRMDEERQRDAFLDDQRREMERDAQDEALRRVVNDPELVLDDEMVSMINDPDVSMDRDMNLKRISRRPMTGRAKIRSSRQFRSLALGVDISDKPQKRARAKTKTDLLMKKALKQANKELRKKNGQLRKGVSQAQLMKRAHRIRKKLSK